MGILHAVHRMDIFVILGSREDKSRNTLTIHGYRKMLIIDLIERKP
jgi:hypothetical protein